MSTANTQEKVQFSMDAEDFFTTEELADLFEVVNIMAEQESPEKVREIARLKANMDPFIKDLRSLLQHVPEAHRPEIQKKLDDNIAQLVERSVQNLLRKMKRFQAIKTKLHALKVMANV